MRGFGAVVTGTLASGEINESDELELLPSGEKVRARGLQTHGKPVKTALAGQRVAVNVAGIDHSKITRGMVLAEPNILKPTQIIDAEIEVLSDAARPLRTRQRVRVALGTSETLARIQVLNSSAEIAAGEKDFIQVRFETPVVAVPGERFIIRSYSPQTTIAGGVVIDALAAKHRRKEFERASRNLRNLLSASDDQISTVSLLIDGAETAGLSFAELQSRTALKSDILKSAIEENTKNGSLVVAGEVFVTADSFKALTKSVEAAIADFHKKEKLAKGISREALREKIAAYLPLDVFSAVITGLHSSGTVVIDKDTIRLAAHKTELSDEEAALSGKILASYIDARLEPSRLDEVLDQAIGSTRFSRTDARKFFQLHLDSGDIVKLADDFYFSKSEINKLVSRLRQFADTTDARLIDVAKFKELAGVSRKYAIPLLEYFDRERITRRAGDKRLILMKKFLTARWQDLIMATYEVAPDLLAPRVPAGTQLDLHDGRCFVSLVGFMFLDTRVNGFLIPLHVNFEEVNLRLYVRRETEGEVRRGVVFIKEIVPRRAIATVARVVYGEPYERWNMSHECSDERVEYAWSKNDIRNAFSVERDENLGVPERRFAR